MKNIHVLPTEQPSRIYLIKSNNKLGITSNNPEFTENFGSGTQNQNLFITSDEEIKEGDWFYLNDAKIVVKYIDLKPVKEAKKIILTTDQDLIKDGVQAIDDEFLEWFVKNPNCESVEVSYEVLKPFQSEEKGYLIHCPDNEVLEEPKQETIREVVKRYYEDNIDESNIPREHYEWEIQDLMIGFAYQWQQERMYSEEEVVQLLQKALTHQDDGEIGSLVTAQKEIRPANFYSWFNKFKNK